MLKVSDLAPDLCFINDSSEVKEIKKLVGRRANNFDCFFVRVKDGEFSEIYGMCGTVPYMSKEVEKLLPQK